MDALCGKDKQDRPVEWINEELLAESLHLHSKQVRKALRWLEQVRSTGCAFLMLPIIKQLECCCKLVMWHIVLTKLTARYACDLGEYWYAAMKLSNAQAAVLLVAQP